MKICTKCKLPKSLEEFRLRKAAKDGRYSECRACEAARAVRKRQENPAAQSEANKRYYAKNRRRERARAKAYQDQHRERYRQYSREYNRANREYKNFYRQVWGYKRRARINNSPTSFTRQEWIELCERCNHQCVACGTEGPLSIDHIVPLSRGGSNGIENIQPLCLPCNMKKHTQTINYLEKETPAA